MARRKTEATLLTAVQLSRLELLRQRSVEPFIELLERVISAEPSHADIQAWAASRPGDWANMVKTVANLAGYADTKEVKHSGILAHIHAMSDAELLEAARTLGTSGTGELLNGKPSASEDKPIATQARLTYKNTSEAKDDV